MRMTKLIVTLTSVLASLGLAGFWPDEPQAPEPPRPPDAPDVVKRIEVVEADAEGSDAAEALRDAYERLAKLRAERSELEGRPREMLSRAVELYRRAVENFDSEEPDRRQEARGLAVAARELARTIERLREVQRTDRPDPELPPPPVGPRMKVRLRELPPIPPELPGGPRGPVPPVPPVPPSLPREARAVIVGPDGKAESKEIIVVTPSGDVLQHDVRGKEARKFEVRVDPERVRALEGRLRAAGGPAAKARIEAFNRAFAISSRLAGGPGQAHRDLQNAYDRIRKAREEYPGEDAKFYLDAARDLYNAARRDAQAGRLDRASELARAAEALTHVPAHLGALGRGPEGEPPKAKRDEIRNQFRYEIRGRRGPDARPEPPREDEDRPREKERRKVEIRVEPKPRAEGHHGERQEEIEVEVRPEEAARAEAEKSGDQVVGIGAAIGLVDDDVVVLSLVPDGPAAKDGRLKKDDILVGVIRDDGEKTEFHGKELTEVVGALRGPAGTRVKLLVRPAGKEEVATYELDRDKVTVPSQAETRANELDRAVQDAIKHLEGAREAARPEEPKPDALPPPLPE
jgi:hypothetical protein